MTSNQIIQPDEQVRAQAAIELRIAGMTYVAIADRLGWKDESGPRKAVRALLARVDTEHAEELRTIEGARLDGLLGAYWPQALDGDTDAAAVVLKVVAQRIKLYGLAPTRFQMGPDPLSEAQFAEQFVGLLHDLGDDGLRQVLNDLPGRPWEILRPPTLEVSTVAVIEDAGNADVERWSNL